MPNLPPPITFFDWFQQSQSRKVLFDTHRVLWFLGAGINKGMYSNDAGVLGDWNELINALDNIGSTGSPLHKAQTVRLRLKIRGDWPRRIYETIGSGIQAVGDISPNWKALITALKDASSMGRAPLCVTTNYDDLLCQHLGWKVLYRKLGSQEVLFAEPAAPGSNRCPELFRYLNYEWELYECHRRGWIEPDHQFVHHFHGWWGESATSPEETSIVFDPGDYRRKEIDPSLPFSRRLESKDDLVMFIGCGGGTLDPHMCEYWNRVERNPSVAASNVWFLCNQQNSNELNEIDQMDELAGAAGLSLEGRVTIVQMTDIERDKLPLNLREMLKM
jgi:SIR2-like domain